MTQNDVRNLDRDAFNQVVQNLLLLWTRSQGIQLDDLGQLETAMLLIPEEEENSDGDGLVFSEDEEEQEGETLRNASIVPLFSLSIPFFDHCFAPCLDTELQALLHHPRFQHLNQPIGEFPRV